MNSVVYHDDAPESEASMYRPHWGLVIVLVLAAIFLVGVGVTGGIR
jgi:hypothetical protein